MYTFIKLNDRHTAPHRMRSNHPYDDTLKSKRWDTAKLVVIIQTQGRSQCSRGVLTLLTLL